MAKHLTKVLFICSANSARSQLAEALLARRGGEQFEVHSAGLESTGVHPMTVRVLNEIGIDWSDAESTSLDSLIGHVYFDYAVIVCAAAAERCPRLYPSARTVLKWPFDDPAAIRDDEPAQLDGFRRVRDEIAERIDAWMTELTAENAVAAQR